MPPCQVMRVRPGNLLPARLQPLLHHLDLVGLGHLDAQAELLHVLARSARREQLGHLDRLRVVGDHSLHEADVAVGVPTFDTSAALEALTIRLS